MNETSSKTVKLHCAYTKHIIRLYGFLSRFGNVKESNKLENIIGLKTSFLLQDKPIQTSTLNAAKLILDNLQTFKCYNTKML